MKILVVALCLAVLFATSVPGFAADRVEGGFNGGSAQEKKTMDGWVYNFLKHFGWDGQFWWCKNWQFTSHNDSWNAVDGVNFAFFAGHGNRMLIKPTDPVVNLRTAGSDPTNWGWGDVNLDFIAFYSCLVIPSPWDTSNWYSDWVSESDDVFDGLHQAMGFRTLGSFAAAPKLCDYFGRLVSLDLGVWQSWFHAINKHRRNELGAAVMHPSAQWDTYGNPVADPPMGHTNLTIWWQY